MAPIRRARKIRLMFPPIRRTLREWFTLSRGMTIMFVLLLLGAVIIVTQQYPSLANPEVFCGYSGVPSPLASLVIEGVDMNSNVVHTTLAFSGFSQRQKDVVATKSMIGLNLRDYALQLDRRGNPYVAGDIPIEAIEGNSFMYPYTSLSLVLEIDPELAIHLDNLSFLVRTRSLGLEFSDINCIKGKLQISVRYSLLLKLIVTVVGGVLLLLLFALWISTDGSSLVEVGIGGFAAVLALRSFLLPFPTPALTFIDVALGMYIPVFFLVFIIKSLELRQARRNPTETIESRRTESASSSRFQQGNWQRDSHDDTIKDLDRSSEHENEGLKLEASGVEEIGATTRDASDEPAQKCPGIDQEQCETEQEDP